MAPTPKLWEERFWPKVKVAGTEECWEWQGALSETGYGLFRKGGRGTATSNAHRALWEQLNGAVPRGLVVCHSCDNRRCVNSNHLWLGTHQENMDDMVHKRRHWVLRGNSSPTRVLTSVQVENIRQTYTTTTISQENLARQYGVNQSTISRIVRWKRWAFLDN